MIIGVLFWVMTLVGCGYAALVGGRDGRWAALLLLAASTLTIPATRLGAQWSATELLILAVDLGLLAGLYRLTMLSRRYFPIWMTGFHLVAVLTHLGAMIAPDFTPKIYRALESLWAVPVTISMIVGIHWDLKTGLRDQKAPQAAIK